jgi:hypothetical protein
MSKQVPQATHPSAGVIHERAMAAALALLVLVPALVALLYVARYDLDVPFYDQWRALPYVDEWLAGRLRFAALFDLHDGHIAVLARAATLLSASWFHWNTLFETWLGFACLAGMVSVVAAYVMFHDEGTHAERALALLPIAIVAFSLRQSENLLAPWSLGFFGAPFFACLAFYLARREGPPWLVGAFAAALFASMCHTNGLLVWLIIPVQKVLQRWQGDARGQPDGGRGSLAGLTLGGLAAVGVWAAYLAAGSRPGAGSTFSVGVVLKRFVVTSGLPLCLDKAVISCGGLPVIVPRIDTLVLLLLGALLLCLLAYTLLILWRARLFGASAFALSVTAFGFGSVAMAAAGRASLGVEQAMSSRYSTPASVALIGVMLLVASATRRGLLRSWLQHALIAVVLTSNVVALATERYAGADRRKFRAEWASAVREFRTASDEDLENPHFAPDEIRAWSAIAERHQLSLFAGSLPVEDDLVAAFAGWTVDRVVSSGVQDGALLKQWPRADGQLATMTLRSGTTYRFDSLHVDAGDALELVVAVPGETGAGATAFVDAIAGGEATRIVERQLAPRAPGQPIAWQSVRVPLEPSAGGVVSLAFGADSPSAEWVAFGAARLVPARLR